MQKEIIQSAKDGWAPNSLRKSAWELGPWVCLYL